MRIRRLWSLAAGLALVAGCASSNKTPKYVTNFYQVRAGHDEVAGAGAAGLPEPGGHARRCPGARHRSGPE